MTLRKHLNCRHDIGRIFFKYGLVHINAVAIRWNQLLSPCFADKPRFIVCSFFCFPVLSFNLRHFPYTNS